MLFTKDNLVQRLREWGAKKRLVPPRNEALKAKVMSEFKPATAVQLRRPIGFWRLALVGVALAALVLVINGGGLLPWGFKTEVMNNDLREASQNYSVSDELGIQYGVATGLGQSDIKTSLPASILNKVASFPRYFDPTVPSSDTREFLKTDYHATLKTRQVEKLSTQIRTMVRGYGGRLDNFSSGEKNAYINFVIPESSLEAFRNEFKDLAPARFLTENIGAQNLLPEKKMIESETDSVNKTKIVLEQERQLLMSKHQATANSLKRQLSATAKSIAALKAEIATTTERQQEIAASLARLGARQSQLEKALAQENYQYGNRFNSLDARLKEMDSQLETLGQQDSALIENVETVQGSVNIQWIGIWEIVALYVPASWLVVIFGAIIVFYFLFGRRQALELP